MSEFLVDDFFVTDGDTVTEDVPMPDRNGVVQQVPITFKRSVSLAEKSAAQLAAIVVTKDSKGEDQLSMNQAVYATEMLARMIVAWPFALPVSADSINKLRSTSGDALVDYLTKKEAPKEAALDSFVPASEAASSSAEVPTL